MDLSTENEVELDENLQEKSVLSTATAGDVEEAEAEEDYDGDDHDHDDNDAFVEATLPFFTALELEVLNTFIKNYLRTKDLSREDCIALDCVFGNMFQQCLEIIGENRVEIKRGSVSGRILVEIQGTGQNYWIPPGNAMCQCKDFQHGSKRGYCKHVLAAHVYLAITSKEKYKKISEHELSSVFQDYFA